MQLFFLLKFKRNFICRGGNECNGLYITTTQTPKTAPIKINLDRMKSALSAEAL